jgi:putative methyltransferase (TIGR04325 family)
MGRTTGTVQGAAAPRVDRLTLMTMASFAHDFLPPVVLRALRSLRLAAVTAHASAVMREFKDWESAAKAGCGYDAAHILERVSAATELVERGGGAYERDSVVFDEVQHSFPVLAGLLRAAAERHGELRVLDFGGSLGSSYRQCRDFLRPLGALAWNIVEQPHFVQRGRDRFASAELQFFGSIEEACATAIPDVALASSVLQYLRDADATIAALRDCGCRYVIIDRTPLHEGSEDRLVLQEVPDAIYAARYPCWIFSRQRLRGRMGPGWEVLAEFDSAVDGSMPTESGPAAIGGFLFRKRSDAAASEESDSSARGPTK